MSGTWPPAVPTAVGSMPGVVALEAARIVAGELPQFVHVVELPGRGPGADLLGRTAAMLTAISADFAVETTPEGWRLAGGQTRQMRRATSWLGEDLDALEETTVGYRGPVKAQITGPWTFAAGVELAGGERILRDHGAVRDLAAGLARAAGDLVGEVRARVPGAADVVVQVDEPGLPACIDGRIGTASGLSTYAAVDEQRAGSVLSAVFDAIVDAGGVPAAHCCADRAPVGLLRSAGAALIGVDLLRAGTRLDTELGSAIEGGTSIAAGCVPAVGVGHLSDTEVSRPVRELLSRLGLTDDRWLANLVLTPTCGLAGASPQWVRTALTACRSAGRVLRADTDPR